MNDKVTPKVFISHASDDKDRFVINFAIKLRAKGIDAWVDKWEMLPGDSLIDKIFDEGIKNADAFIIILSAASVNKKWVREELNAGIVKKIDDNTKLIPVVIDDCEIPQVLKSTLWIKIEDLENYELELDRIINSIFGHNDKPPLGSPPSYTQTIINNIPTLTRIDNLILKFSCELADDKSSEYIFSEDIPIIQQKIDIHEDEFYESLDILDSRGYIEADRRVGSRNMHDFKITLFGYEEYAEAYIDNYSSIIESVGAEIVNLNARQSKAISNTINQPLMLVNHILEMFESRNFVQISRMVGDGDGSNLRIYSVSPELKRGLSESNFN